MPQQGILPPPPGVEPNFDNPEDRFPFEPAVAYVGIALSTLFLAMRVYTKAYINRFFGGEDVCMIFAWFLSVANTAVILSCNEYFGGGHHGWEVTADQFAGFQKVVFSTAVLLLFSIAVTKVSILLLFRKITPERMIHWAIWVVMFILVCCTTALLLALIFACDPIKKNWDPTITSGSCINRTALYIATASFGIITDVLLILIPIPMIRHLQLPLPQKIGVACIFAVGSLTLVTSIIRLVVILPLSQSVDPTWDVATPGLWAIVELHLLIICPCCISLKAFLRRHAPILLGEKTSYGSGASGKPFSKTASSGGIVRNVTFGTDRPAENSIDESSSSKDEKYANEAYVRPGQHLTSNPMQGDSRHNPAVPHAV